MITILVVEDEPSVSAAVRDLLERDGDAVRHAASIAQARTAFDDSVDLVLLDWRLPDGEGIDLLKEWRKTSETPVLLVTARVDVIDRVLGLEIGADDYITKPFEPRELLARIKVRLRSHKKVAPVPKRTVEASAVRIDLETREVSFEGRPIVMTRMELDLLALLLEHPGRVFSREELLNRVWGYERTPTTRTVDAHVLQLRTKLRFDLIESVRGIGYRLKRET